MRRLLLPLALLLAVLVPAIAAAHEVRPAYLEISETHPGEWSVTWKQPVMGDQAVRLTPRLSNGWLDRKPSDEALTRTHFLRRWQIRAPAAQLVGSTLAIDGLDRTITDVLVHVHTVDGKGIDRILNRGHTGMTIAFGKRGGLAVPAYLTLGVNHILTGIDHLLFVLGLLMLVGGGWRLLKAITSFTLAHSITLAASALGLVQAPVRVIEALIAWSIVFVAFELTRKGGRGVGLTARFPWVIAFTFGLLHGFGFAGALAETGLPKDNIPAALLLFNLGVEVGQLMFVGAVLLVMFAWRRLAAARLPRAEYFFSQRLAPYFMGCYAAFLFAERTAAAFA